MHTLMFRTAVVITLLLAGSTVIAESGPADLRDEVEAIERAFARTMADRDHAAFTAFLSNEAVFISGPSVLRGKQEVAEQWKAYFEGPEAPFSWEPEQIELLDSGSLALSSGPVRDAAGALVATFTSVWRQEAPGVWRIVLDKGNQVCPEPPTPAQEPAGPDPTD